MDIVALVNKAKQIRPSPTEDFYTLTRSQMQEYTLMVIDEFTKMNRALSELERDDWWNWPGLPTAQTIRNSSSN